MSKIKIDRIHNFFNHDQKISSELALDIIKILHKNDINFIPYVYNHAALYDDIFLKYLIDNKIPMHETALEEIIENISLESLKSIIENGGKINFRAIYSEFSCNYYENKDKIIYILDNYDLTQLETETIEFRQKYHTLEYRVIVCDRILEQLKNKKLISLEQ